MMLPFLLHIARLLAVLSFSLSVAAAPVRLNFVGDILLDDGPGKVIASGGDPLAPFANLLRDADFTVGNLECPLATTGAPIPDKVFAFRAHPRAVFVLDGRIDALALSNNHSGDFGPAAFIETLEHLERAGIPYFGGGRTLTHAHAPLWIERKGMRIAVLGYNEYKPRSFEAGADWPGIAWSEDAQVIADIRAARAAGADLVIPFMHWGWENEPDPSVRQKHLARRMIDAGADLVIGGHPHITQGAEYYRGKLIVYSLGNFVFDGFETESGRRGWLLRLTLDRDGLLAWDTVVAAMDEEGTPHPLPDISSPCGKRGSPDIRQCRPLLQDTATSQ